MPPHPERAAILAIIPHFTGALSMLGSAWIVVTVQRDTEKRGSTYHRTLAALSICDITSSFGYFLSTWPMPKDSLIEDTYAYAYVGNARTCAAQGFLIHFGITVAFYNVLLALYYVLVVRYNARTAMLKRKFEPLLLLPPIFGILLCLPGVVFQFYNNSSLWCWYAPNWDRCGELEIDAQTCVRTSLVIYWAVYWGPLWVCIILITFLHGLLYWTVKRIEARVSRYQPGADRERHRKSRKVAMQAVMYVSIFYIAWLPSTIAVSISTATGNWHSVQGNYFGLYIFIVTFQPFQGFLNFLAFHRVKVKRYCKAICRKTFCDYLSCDRSKFNSIAAGSVENTSAGEGRKEDNRATRRCLPQHRRDVGSIPYHLRTIGHANGFRESDQSTDTRVFRSSQSCPGSTVTDEQAGENCHSLLHEGAIIPSDEVVGRRQENFGKLEGTSCSPNARESICVENEKMALSDGESQRAASKTSFRSHTPGDAEGFHESKKSYPPRVRESAGSLAERTLEMTVTGEDVVIKSASSFSGPSVSPADEAVARRGDFGNLGDEDDSDESGRCRSTTSLRKNSIETLSSVASANLKVVEDFPADEVDCGDTDKISVRLRLEARVVGNIPYLLRSRRDGEVVRKSHVSTGSRKRTSTESPTESGTETTLSTKTDEKKELIAIPGEPPTGSMHETVVGTNRSVVYSEEINV